ncbi:hypothetical protein Y032_0006g3021 [Ancylostoma ceylanicum]|nr:hypothetical protein Y032_0006g3021 [Ancylostoma ceylanicum]
MKIGKNHPDVPFLINGAMLKETKTIRDLGLIYTDTLDFTTYISDVVAKAKCRSSFILKAFKTRNPTTLFKLFTTYVRPLLEYCSPIWSPIRVSQIDEIESVQKSFTYRCFARKGMFRTPYDVRLKKLSALSLRDRRLIIDISFMYKLTTGEVDLAISDLFEISPFKDFTRGHPFKVRLFRSNCSAYDKSFPCRVQSLWNSLDPKLFRYRRAATFQQHLIEHLRLRNMLDTC